LECYIISIDSLIIPLLSAFWIMLPAYLPNPVAALAGGGVPIDMGRNYSDGRRIFGDGKTIRGLIVGILAGICIGILQILLSSAYPLDFLPQHTLLSVTLLSAGALLGDLCKSFFKRRRGLARGEKWFLADQYDLVAGSLLLLLVFDTAWALQYVTIPVLIVILIATPLLHRAVNIIGYKLKVKEEPW
jgi:CDP-2,3-bis-(O-geranylgeranyl)-sn-glycerol synthase